MRTDAFPTMKGNARMARGAGNFEVPLFSNVDGNLWQGCSPAEYFCISGKWIPGFHWLKVPDESYKPVNPKLVKLKPRFDAILNLYIWEKYPVPNEVDYREAMLTDSTDELDQDEIDDLAKWVLARLSDDKTVLVHCQAGLNRSSLVVARALMLGKEMSADEAIEVVRKSRSETCLCNDHFADWLRSL